MRWFLRTVWDGIRGFGVGMALGTLIADLTFASNPPAWPTPALYKYVFFAVFGCALIGLFRAWRASASREPDPS